MPLYDYQCTDCENSFTLLKGVIADAQSDLCPDCGSSRITRLISRFSRLRSDDAVIDDLADPAKIGDLDDPGQLKRWMRSVGKEIGDDLGDDFDEMLDESSEDETETEYDRSL